MKNLKIYNPKLLLEELNVNKIPNINQVIKSSGINIKTVPNICGMKDCRSVSLIDPERKKGIIYLNSRLPKKTRNFIAAYMYSYIELYYDEELFANVLYNEENFDKNAYNYALRLLMPEKIFKNDIQKGLKSKDLSRKYNVTKFVVDERKELMNRDKIKSMWKVIPGRIK